VYQPRFRALGDPPGKFLSSRMSAYLTVGLAATVAVTRLLETILFQVEPNDPWSTLALPPRPVS
jgi:hypothetical protein